MATEGVERVFLTEEDEYFPLPPQLRKLMETLQRLVEGGYGASPATDSGPIDLDREFSATEALDLLGL